MLAFANVELLEIVAPIGLVSYVVLARTVLAQTLPALLYRVTPNDRWTMRIAVVVMLAVVCFASYLPARRAARVDPLIALRYE